MSEWTECPRCGKLQLPEPSEWMLQAGHVCACTHVRHAGTPQTPKRATGHVEAEKPAGRDWGTKKVTLPYPPSANTFKVWTGSRFTLSEEARAYKQFAAWKVSEAKMYMHAGYVGLHVHVYRPRKRGDIDNVLKLAIDALTGYAFKDDDQVTELHAYRHEDKENPRVEIEVRSV